MNKIELTTEMSCVAFSSNFQELYIDACKTKTWKKISKLLDERIYTVKNIGVSNRVVSHWDSQEVTLPDQRPNEKKWRKFNFQEIVWLQILQELRAFGMSMEQLKTAQKSMFTFQQKKLLWPFKLAIFLSLQPESLPIRILVFQNGEVLMGTEEYMDMIEDLKPSCIKINLNSICAQLLKRKAFNSPSKIKTYLNEAQFEVLNYMEEKKYQEIMIGLEKDNEYRVQLTDINKPDVTIGELMQMTNHGEITVKIANGEVIWTRRYQKKRIKR